MHEGEHGIIDDAEHELASKFGHPKKDGHGHDHDHSHSHDHHHGHAHTHGARDHDAHSHEHGGHSHAHAHEARKGAVTKVVAGGTVVILAGLFLFLRFL